jgi:heme-degrading monooxygenase HmoA
MIRHKVNDYAVWKDVFDDFADFRRSSGEKSFRIFHPADDANDLTLLIEWDTRENAEQFLASHELRTKMQEAGVAESPTVHYFVEAASGSLEQGQYSKTKG